MKTASIGSHTLQTEAQVLECGHLTRARVHGEAPPLPESWELHELAYEEWSPLAMEQRAWASDCGCLALPSLLAPIWSLLGHQPCLVVPDGGEEGYLTESVARALFERGDSGWLERVYTMSGSPEPASVPLYPCASVVSMAHALLQDLAVHADSSACFFYADAAARPSLLARLQDPRPLSPAELLAGGATSVTVRVCRSWLRPTWLELQLWSPQPLGDRLHSGMSHVL